MIVIIVIALLVLSYFGYNLRAIVNAPNTQDNFSFVGGVVVDVWNNYLKVPATFVWNVFVNFIWTPAIDNLKSVNTASSTLNTFQGMAPTVSPGVYR